MGIYGADWADYQSARPSTAGLAYGFTKVSEGLGYVNPEWASQYRTAVAAGLVPGKYHYPHMANAASAEVDYFLAHADVRPGDLLALDWEGNGPGEANAGLPDSQLAAFKDDWLAEAKARCPENPVGLYCDKSFWLDIDTTSYCQDFLWIATAGVAAGEPGIQYPWLFHQYGTAAGADADYCHLPSAAALRAWAATFQGVPPVAQTLTPTGSTGPWTRPSLCRPLPRRPAWASRSWRSARCWPASRPRRLPRWPGSRRRWPPSRLPWARGAP